MRFHKAESAFFVFVAVVFVAGALTLHAYMLLRSAAGIGDAAALLEQITFLNNHLFATGVLLATAIVFGVFFIYPIIRTQVREEGELRAMTEALSQRSQSFRHAALTDALTGMQNRRYFDDALREYLEAFREIRKPVGLMILDLDHFKQINDTYGHDIGDAVLQDVAECLLSMKRYHDVVARLGGEEFAIVAPNMEHDKLTSFAERIRTAVSERTIATRNVKLKVTASFGLAVWDGKETADEFLRRADAQLYEAKRTGRNRVCA